MLLALVTNFQLQLLLLLVSLGEPSWVIEQEFRVCDILVLVECKRVVHLQCNFSKSHEGVLFPAFEDGRCGKREKEPFWIRAA